MTRTRLAFVFGLLLTLAIYGIMVSWSLPFIAQSAGGLMPFDLRPLGYSYEEARQFLAALPPEGASFYVNVQHRLDTVYPALLAVMVGAAVFTLAPAAWGGWRWPLAVLAVPGAIFDYLENRAIAAMLEAGEAGLTPAMAETASLWTVLKSAFSALAMTVLLILIAFALVRWFVRRSRASIGCSDGLRR